jgi:2-C-methyl-D-erythritol 4-phosphate cytidylyltransferase
MIPAACQCSAVVVASGGSRRMGFDKLTAPLGGQPLLARTLAALAACPAIAEILLVCPQARWEAIGAPTATNGIPIHRIDGGAERQDSVAAGLAAAKYEITLVHDGARPLVDPDDVSRCIAAAIAEGAATLARPVADTLRRADGGGFAAEIVDRNRLWAVETPQCAATATLHRALAEVAATGLCVTDETTALAHIGVRVRLVESRHPNPKITTPADLALAAALLA